MRGVPRQFSASACATARRVDTVLPVSLAQFDLAMV